MIGGVSGRVDLGSLGCQHQPPFSAIRPHGVYITLLLTLAMPGLGEGFHSVVPSPPAVQHGERSMRPGVESDLQGAG